jgi:hypothetical protein
MRRIIRHPDSMRAVIFDLEATRAEAAPSRP